VLDSIEGAAAIGENLPPSCDENICDELLPIVYSLGLISIKRLEWGLEESI
jgi:hypothetical protein